MRTHHLERLLLAVFLLPLPAYGQQAHEHNQDVTGPRANYVSGVRQGPDLAQVERLIFEGTNAFRARHHRAALKLNATLIHSAQYFADFMAHTDKYGHEADGKTPWARTAEFGYDDCIVAENIAWILNSAGFTTQQLADKLLKGWENSPPHRRNMLDPDLKEIGVGVARSARTGKYYAVQDFGRPRSDQIVFQVSNRTDTTAQYAVDGKSFSLPPDYTRTHWRCRPPAVVLDQQTLHPPTNTEYVVTRNQAGKLRVERSRIPPTSAATPSNKSGSND